MKAQHTQQTAVQTPAHQTREARIAELQQKIAENERVIAETLAELRPSVVRQAMDALATNAHQAGVTPKMSPKEARECLMAYLIGAESLAVPPVLISNMARYGFDASRVTYGELSGQRIAYIDGLSLLKFVGFVRDDAPSLRDAALDAAVGDNATQH